MNQTFNTNWLIKWLFDFTVIKKYFIVISILLCSLIYFHILQIDKPTNSIFMYCHKTKKHMHK